MNTAEDANLDLVVTFSSDSHVWKGNGNATFAAPMALGIGAGEPKFGEFAGGSAPDACR